MSSSAPLEVEIETEPTLLEIANESAPVRVILGSALTSIATSTSVSLWAVSKGIYAVPHGVSTAINTFSFAFPFFALREYIISPFLFPSASTQQPGFLTGVPQSAIAGAITGAGMMGAIKGIKRAPKGGSTFLIVASLGHLALNSANMARHAIINRGTARAAVVEANTPTSFNPSEGSESKSWISKASNKLAAYSPVRKISDEEYSQRLAERESEIEKRLSELKEELAQAVGSTKRLV